MKRGIVTARGYQKLTAGHPWLMAADLEDPAMFGTRPGAVQLGEHWFFHSPASAIRLRRFGPLERNWMAAAGNADQSSTNDPGVFKRIFSQYLAEHVTNLLETKKRLVLSKDDDLCLRWIFSENDLLPGLTVDIFGDIAVAEINSAPIETFWFPIREALESVLKPLNIKLIESRHNDIRKKEGLEVIALENPLPARWLKFNSFETWCEPAGSQKTGMYLDQKFNHRVATEWATRMQLKTAYDVFCFQGGFSLHLAKAGLAVTAVDQSASALAVATKNAERNNVAFATVEADAFNWLKQQPPTEMIVLDPPAMAGAKNNLDSAVRALVQLHVDALQALKPGGLLVTCTCSQALTDEVLTRVLREAGQQTRRSLNILEKRGPSPDHPVLPNFPEGDYLRAWFVQI